MGGLTHHTCMNGLLLIAVIYISVTSTFGYESFARELQREPSDVHLFFSRFPDFDDNGKSHFRHRRAVEFGDQVRALENLQLANGPAASIQNEIDNICGETGYLSPAVGECDPEDQFRTIDASCNNIEFPYWGKSFRPFRRVLPAQYTDGVSSFRRAVNGGNLPSARDVSLAIIGSDNIVDPYGGSDLIMHFGQFVDHDMDQAPLEAESCVGCLESPVCKPIAVPTNDPVIPDACILFRRSLPTINSNCQPGRRNQINIITSFVDASQVYGNNAARVAILRDTDKGLLRTMEVEGQKSPGAPNDDSNANCAVLVEEQKCALTGDGRAAEQPGLTAIHLLFIREHNRIARALAKLNPHWKDERLYQEARKINGAQLQHITFNEYLPLMVGGENMEKYNLKISKRRQYKYDTNVDPTVSHNFATASFRNGHSQISEILLRLNQDYQEISAPVLMKLGFFNATYAFDTPNGGLEALLLGTLVLPVQKIDNNFAEAVFHQLFADPQEQFGMDLPAINLQRGRDHGLPSYNDYREHCGFPRIQSFEELRAIMPTLTVDGIISVYDHVDDIDLFVGCFSENIETGSLQGPTSNCLISQDFQNVKFGDRYWYENREGPQAFSKEQMTEIQKVTFSRVVCENIDTVKFIQPYAFKLPDESSIAAFRGSFATYSQWTNFPDSSGQLPEFSNKPVACDNKHALPRLNLWPWKEFGKQ